MDFAALLAPLVNSTTRLAILPCAEAAHYGGRCLDAEPSKFDLIAIRSSHFHRQRNASHSLRAASRRLAPGGRMLVSCDAAVATAGIAHFRSLLAIGTEHEAALLRALPPANWLSRNPAMRSRADLWAPRPTPELHLAGFVSLLARAGLRVRSLPSAPAPPKLACGDDACRRLRRRISALRGAARAQFAELFFGNVLQHVALVEPGRPSAEDAAFARALAGRLDSDVLEALAPEAATATVRRQYEALPFPPRRPADERTRLLRSSFGSLAEVSHFVFGGRLRRRLCGRAEPFRALVAGGGTGDVTVQLAQELADAHARAPRCGFDRATVVHLDLSAASTRVAAARLRERRLGASPRVRLVSASLEELPRLGLGAFDYINCVGVVHHTRDPLATLRALAAALKPGGGLALMVYGSLGRAGVYETQAMLRLLHAAGNATDGGAALAEEARVEDARALLAALPDAHPLRRNRPIWSSEEVQGRMGSSGLFDLLLHSVDRAYTRPQLLRLAARAGLRPSSWLMPKLYEPEAWVSATRDAPLDGSLMRRLASLDPEARAEVAELLGGHARKHWVVLVRSSHPAAEVAVRVAADALDDEAAPCPLNMSKATLSLLTAREGRPFTVRTELQGEALLLRMPARSAAILRRLDCRTPLARVRDAVLAAEGGGVGERASFDADWRQLYDALRGVGYLTMTDHELRI